MSDKTGDRFTDKMGKSYELRPDPKGGHLRPYTVKDANHKNVLAAILTPIITVAVVGVVGVVGGGLRWMWDKITKRNK